MSFLQVVILAVVQGFAELLPISSSAHVVVAEKLMGMDPSSPQMTMLLVMLHTGTMIAVIVYFWRQWSAAFFRNTASLKRFVFLLFVATALTGIVGEALIKFIEKVWFRATPNAEVEQLFGHLELIAPALAVAGILILIAGLYSTPSVSADAAPGTGATSLRPAHKTGSHERGERDTGEPETDEREKQMDTKQAGLIGAVQGLCLPFRGFSRSGATISTGMLAGVGRMRAEEFSFALAVVLTPLADGRELLRLMRAEHISGGANLAQAVLPGFVGALCALVAGLLALKWLSRWLEGGRWYIFGIYCLVAAAGVAALHYHGY